MIAHQSDTPKATFGSWLLAQKSRSDAVGHLAQAAATDRQFPRDGDPKAVSRRLNQLGADTEMHEALEAAELDYHCH